MEPQGGGRSPIVERGSTEKHPEQVIDATTLQLDRTKGGKKRQSGRGSGAPIPASASDSTDSKQRDLDKNRRMERIDLSDVDDAEFEELVKKRKLSKLRKKGEHQPPARGPRRPLSPVPPAQLQLIDNGDGSSDSSPKNAKSDPLEEVDDGEEDRSPLIDILARTGAFSASRLAELQAELEAGQGALMTPNCNSTEVARALDIHDGGDQGYGRADIKQHQGGSIQGRIDEPKTPSSITWADAIDINEDDFMEPRKGSLKQSESGGSGSSSRGRAGVKRAIRWDDEERDRKRATKMANGAMTPRTKPSEPYLVMRVQSLTVRRSSEVSRARTGNCCRRRRTRSVRSTVGSKRA